MAARVVEDALVPALHLKKKAFGDSDEYKAMRADAVSLALPPPLFLSLSLSLSRSLSLSLSLALSLSLSF